MGMTAGGRADAVFCVFIVAGVGAVVGNPAEVALVRMTSDGRLPAAERRNYSNAFSAVVCFLDLV